MIRKTFFGVVLVAFLLLSTGCQSWELSGNSGTNPNTNFLGTTDKKPLNIKAANNTAIHIDTLGNVGIGTTSPSARLEITGGGRVTKQGGQLNIMSNTYLFPLSPRGSQNHHFFIVLSSDDNGNLLFGQTKTIDAKSNANYSAFIDGSTNQWSFLGNVGIGKRAQTHPLEIGPGGAYVTAGGKWVDGSSREFKENIHDLTDEEAVEVLSKIEPKKFNYKVDKDEQCLGFIAEDVPDLVATSDRKGLSSMDIVAVLTKVVQQQQKKIEELEARFKDDK